MNLIIDIGNTLVKAAVFDEEKIVEKYIFEQREFIAKMNYIFTYYPFISKTIVSSTKSQVSEVIKYLKERNDFFIYFDENTLVPIINKYGTPTTLGRDRLAAAVGASCQFPAANLLIIDFGSAITFDIVTCNGEFIGGNISPGVSMRFKSLNLFTDLLPLRSLPDNPDFIGNSTDEAIEYGVVNGILFEIEGYIQKIKNNYKDFKVVLTGGDANYFAKRVKNPIFANCDLVLYGLNMILNYNVQTKN